MARHIDPENLTEDDITYLDDRVNAQRDLELHTGKTWKEIRAKMVELLPGTGIPAEDEDSDEDDSDEDPGSEPQGDDEEDDDDQDDDDEAEDYSEWEYTDLVAEVKERGLETDGRKTEDLINALVDDDLNSESDEDSDEE